MIPLNVKQNIVAALCNHLALDPEPFSGELESSDLKSICTNVLKSLNDDLVKVIGFTESILEKNSPSEGLTVLNDDLLTKSVVSGKGYTPSVADSIVFGAVYSSLIGVSDSDKLKLPHLFRWADHIQKQVKFGNRFEKIIVHKPHFDIPVPSKKDLVTKETSSSEVDSKSKSNAKKSAQDAKEAGSSEAESKPKSADAGDKGDKKKKKAEVSSQGAADKKKSSEKEADKKDEELSVSILKIQIGLIRKAWKHPSADSLLVEEIDTGDAKCRQVVSGLAKYCTPEELTNRLVVLITNVKPGKLRDIMSEGLVLCASNQDHTVVQPLNAPEGAKPGECVTFSGHDGKPEEVLNPKKKQLDKITPNLFTDDKGVATFKGVPFMTSAGPCTSSITNGSIK